MKFREIIEFIQGKLLPIIAEKDSSKKEALIVNLTVAIRRIETDYPLTLDQIKALEQIVKILAKEFYLIKNPLSDLDKIENSLDDFISQQEKIEKGLDEFIAESEGAELLLSPYDVPTLFTDLSIAVFSDNAAQKHLINTGIFREIEPIGVDKKGKFQFDVKTEFSDGKTSTYYSGGKRPLDFFEDLILKNDKQATMTPLVNWEERMDILTKSSSYLSDLTPIAEEKLQIFFQVQLELLNENNNLITTSFTPSEVIKYIYKNSDGTLQRFYKICSMPNEYFFLRSIDYDQIDGSKSLMYEKEFVSRYNTFRMYFRLSILEYSFAPAIKEVLKIQKLRFVELPTKSSKKSTPKSTRTKKNKSGQGRKTSTAWIYDLDISGAVRTELISWFTGVSQTILIGEINEISDPSFSTSIKNRVEIDLTNSSGSTLVFLAENNNNLRKITIRKTIGRTQDKRSVHEFKTLKAFNTALKKSLIENLAK